MNPCPLCERLRPGKNKDGPLVRDKATSLFEGPFFTQWPGSLMLVSNRHVQEQSDLRPSHAREMWLDLLDAERALRHATACDRVNVVKFGNAAPKTAGSREDARIRKSSLTRERRSSRPTSRPCACHGSSPRLR